MPTESPEEPTETAIESITDPLALRDRDDVPFHEDDETVDAETFEAVDGLEDLAVVGVTNDDGAVLLRKLTAECDWKLPLGSASRGEDYAEAARRAVEDVIGLEIALEALEGVWHHEVRREDDGRVALRSFVVFSATPEADGASVDDPIVDGADSDEVLPADVGWFDELPTDAPEVPGTRLFFD